MAGPERCVECDKVELGRGHEQVARYAVVLAEEGTEFVRFRFGRARGGIPVLLSLRPESLVGQRVQTAILARNLAGAIGTGASGQTVPVPFDGRVEWVGAFLMIHMTPAEELHRELRVGRRAPEGPPDGR